MTKAGVLAVEQHFNDSKKEGFKNRYFYRKLFKEEHDKDILDNTIGLTLWSLNRFIVPEGMCPIIQKMMTDNGVVEGEDYEISIVDEEV